MIDNDFIEPHVTLGALDYISRTFNCSEIVQSSKCKNNDELVGYLRGVTDVLNFIKHLTRRGEDVEM